MPVLSNSRSRRWVSVNREFPPSIITSSFSSSGATCPITESTGGPAFTIIIATRGFLSAPTNSSSVRVGLMFFPWARSAANFSVTSVVRLNTATEKPLDSMFRTRFSPMTPRPVRPMEDGREIEGIDYEAHREMAEHQLKRIAEQAADRFGLKRIIVRHRIGFIAVGEASLFVQVASLHRGEGFRATQWIVDELKKSVPIWKRPAFAKTTAGKPHLTS